MRQKWRIYGLSDILIHDDLDQFFLCILFVLGSLFHA